LKKKFTFLKTYLKKGTFNSNQLYFGFKNIYLLAHNFLPS